MSWTKVEKKNSSQTELTIQTNIRVGLKKQLLLFSPHIILTFKVSPFSLGHKIVTKKSWILTNHHCYLSQKTVLLETETL